MPAGEHFGTNVPQTTMTAPSPASNPTISVNSSSGFPSTPFTAVLGLGTSLQEAIYVTNVSGVTWTVTRGYAGTVSQNQPLNQTVTHATVGVHFTEPRSHIDSAGPLDASSQAVHGLTNTSGNVVVGTKESQTLINKTLTTPVINTPTLNGSGGTLTLPAGPDTLVGRATTDTLTNKTLTAPVISTIVNTGTLTLPTSTDTMVGRATTDTLTNKTINGAALSGTFSGAHTYSGLPTFSAGLTVSNGQQATLANNLVKPVAGVTEQTYTPTLAGTGATVGNGTLSGLYVQYGFLTFVEIQFQFGTTSSLSTSGATTFTLPNTPSKNAVLNGFYMKGTNQFDVKAVPTTNGGTTIELVAPSGSTGGIAAFSFVTSTVPTSQDNTVVVYLSGFYQATT